MTTIGSGAFCGCSSLTSLNIPDSVTHITGGNLGWPHNDNGAFTGCSGLTNVKIGTGLTCIELGTFAFCESLTNITIPDNVFNIEGGAFDGCSSLSSVAIPNSVTNIAPSAFIGCTGLTALTVNPLNPVYGSADGILFNKDLSRLILCPQGKAGSYTIPNSVRSIEDGAFQACTSLTSITVPSSVNHIGVVAFEICTSLSRVLFEGNAPMNDEYVFVHDDMATVYYLPGTTGWGTVFAGRPTAPWVLSYPVVLATAPNFGIQTNGFGFRISWATNTPVVVEASTSLANPVWAPVHTNVLQEGWSDFIDQDWKAVPTRFYRVRGGQ